MTPSKEMLSDNLKLAVISHLFPDEHSPIQGKFIKDHLDLLAQEEWIHPTLIVPTPYSIPFTRRHKKNNSSLRYDKGKSKRIKFLSFPRKVFAKLAINSLSRNLNNYFSNHTFHGVHVHWLYPDGLSIPALSKLGLNTILTIHGSDWYKNHKNEALKESIHKAFKHSKRILLVGPTLLQDVKLEYPEYQEKLYEIGNYINESLYTQTTKQQKSRAVANLNWNSNKKHFLTVASLNREKGINLLLQAIKLLPQSINSNLTFHVVGVTDSDALSVNNVPENMLFHPPIDPKNLIQYYQAADAYVSPSRKEGFGLALIEAAASGLPAVATSTGIASSFINSSTGILCPTNNYIKLSDAIGKLAEMLADFEARNIRDKAIKEFGKETYRSNLLTHYRDCFMN